MYNNCRSLAHRSVVQREKTERNSEKSNESVSRSVKDVTSGSMENALLLPEACARGQLEFCFTLTPVVQAK